jgi:MarR-like DNA-binding transcriptional regulator SgrR of sgrS sRNA
MIFCRVIIVALSLILTLSGSEAIEMKKLVGSLNGLPQNLDPAAVVSSAVWHTLLNLGVNLVTHDRQGHLIGDAASEWTVSPDFTAFEFSLQKNLKDSEGNPLQSSDWKASFLYLLRSGGSTHSFIGEFLDESGIETPDPYTLKLKLKKSYQALLERLTTPEFILVPKKALSSGKVDLHVSSGAYFVQEFDPSKKKCILRANHYFSHYSPEQAEQVTLEPIPEHNGELFDKLSRGEWNFAISTVLPVDDQFAKINNLIEQKKVIAHSVQPSSIGMLILRDHSKRLSSRATRMALLKLIWEHSKLKMQGPTSQPAFQLYPPGFAGALPPDQLDEIVTRILKNSDADAKSLPKKLIAYEAALSTSYGLSSWVVKIFKDAGIAVERHEATANHYIPHRNDIDHDYLAFTTGLNSKEAAGSLLYLITQKDGLIPDQSGELAKLVESAVQKNADERIKILHQVSEKLITEGKIIPIVHYGTSILSSANIEALPPTEFDDELKLNTIRWK